MSIRNLQIGLVGADAVAKVAPRHRLPVDGGGAGAAPISLLGRVEASLGPVDADAPGRTRRGGDGAHGVGEGDGDVVPGPELLHGVRRGVGQEKAGVVGLPAQLQGLGGLGAALDALRRRHQLRLLAAKAGDLEEEPVGVLPDPAFVICPFHQVGKTPGGGH